MSAKRFFSAFLAVAGAAAIACASSAWVLAAPSYTVTELTVPQDAAKEFGSWGFLADGSGQIDAFTVTFNPKNSRKPQALLHHQSTDGGKSWKTVGDTGWLAEYAKKYDTAGDRKNSPDYFYPERFVGDGKGNFYFLASTGRHDFGENSVGTLKRLYRLTGGTIQELAALDETMEHFQMLDFSDRGIAMYAGVLFEDNRHRFRFRDPATGKTTYEHIFDGMRPWGYGGGMVYGKNAVTDAVINNNPPELYGREPGKQLWLGYDIAQEKETLALTLPFGDGYEACVAGDGACWFAAPQGLFRLERGASALTKIEQANPSQFSGDRRIVWMAAGKQNDVYLLTCYDNPNNHLDPKNDTQMKLLHYTPA